MCTAHNQTKGIAGIKLFQEVIESEEGFGGVSEASEVVKKLVVIKPQEALKIIQFKNFFVTCGLYYCTINIFIQLGFSVSKVTDKKSS